MTIAFATEAVSDASKKIAKGTQGVAMTIASVMGEVSDASRRIVKDTQGVDTIVASIIEGTSNVLILSVSVRRSVVMITAVIMVAGFVVRTENVPTWRAIYTGCAIATDYHNR